MQSALLDREVGTSLIVGPLQKVTIAREVLTPRTSCVAGASRRAAEVSIALRPATRTAGALRHPRKQRNCGGKEGIPCAMKVTNYHIAHSRSPTHTGKRHTSCYGRNRTAHATAPTRNAGIEARHRTIRARREKHLAKSSISNVYIENSAAKNKTNHLRGLHNYLGIIEKTICVDCLETTT